MATEMGGVPIIFGFQDYPSAIPPLDPETRYAGLKPETLVLRKGHQQRPGAARLICDILFERDIAIKVYAFPLFYDQRCHPSTLYSLSGPSCANF